MKKVIIIILCLAIAACIATFFIHASNTIKAEKIAREQELEAIKEKYSGSLPVIKMQGKSNKQTMVAHYRVLVTDSAYAIGNELAEMCELYGVAYTLSSDGYSAYDRTCNGVPVYGSYEMDIKSQLISAIENGEDFYIGVGMQDERDSYSATNIEAMCQFLSDYIADGRLRALELD